MKNGKLSIVATLVIIVLVIAIAAVIINKFSGGTLNSYDSIKCDTENDFDGDGINNWFELRPSKEVHCPCGDDTLFSTFIYLVNDKSGSYTNKLWKSNAPESIGAEDIEILKEYLVAINKGDQAPNLGQQMNNPELLASTTPSSKQFCVTPKDNKCTVDQFLTDYFVKNRIGNTPYKLECSVNSEDCRELMNQDCQGLLSRENKRNVLNGQWTSGSTGLTDYLAAENE